jgi:hypothetical protein
VDDSIKFTPERATVVIEIEPSREGISVSVQDETPGNGLGLALVSAIARLQDLALNIQDAIPFGGVGTGLDREGGAVAGRVEPAGGAAEVAAVR